MRVQQHQQKIEKEGIPISVLFFFRFLRCDSMFVDRLSRCFTDSLVCLNFDISLH